MNSWHAVRTTSTSPIAIQSRLRRGLASLAMVATLCLASAGAAVSASQPLATLAPLHPDSARLAAAQGQDLPLEVVKRVNGRGIEGQTVDWTVSGPGKVDLAPARSMTIAQTPTLEAGTAATIFHASLPGDYVVTASTQKNPGCAKPGCATWVSTRFAVNVAAAAPSDGGGASSDSGHGEELAVAAAIIGGGLALAAGSSHGNDDHVAPLGRDLVAISGDGQSAAQHTGLAHPLTVRAISGGVDTAGVQIQWTATGGATLSGSTSTTDANGLASIDVTNVGAGPGPVHITATRSDFPGATATFTANVLLPNLTISSGDGQTGFTSSNAAAPLVVEAELGSAPQPQVPITWEVTSGDATITSVSNGGVTNATGLSKAFIHFNATPGPITVTATRTDANITQTFHLTSTITNSLRIVNGDDQAACPNRGLPQSLLVKATTNGHPVSGVTVNFAAGGTTVLNRNSDVTDAGGFAQAHVNSIGPDYQAFASNVSVTATRADDPSASVTFNEPVAASVLSNSSGDGQSGTIGSTSSPLVVLLLDGCGQPIKNQPVTWSVVSGSATLHVSNPNTNVNGNAQATITYNNTPQTVVVQASALGGGLTTSFSATSTTSGFNITAGNNQTKNPGQTAQLSVSVTPAVAGVPVTFTVLGGSGSTVGPQPVTTNGSGIATTTLTFGSTPVAFNVQAQTGSSVQTFNERVAGSLVTTNLKIISGNNQVIAPGSPSVPLVVELDGNGSPLSGQTINWSTSSGTLSSSAMTGSNGQAQVTLTPSSSGPVTVNASFAAVAQYSASNTVSFSENTTISTTVAPSTNDQSVAQALDSACADLQKISNRTPQQQDLLNQCLALGQSSTVSQGSVAQAIHQMSPAVAETQTSTATTATTTQFSNLAGRMQALRGGAHGASFAGLAFDNDNGSLGLGDLGSAALGASDAKKNDDSAGFSRWGFFGSGQIQRQDASAQSGTPGYSFGSNGLTFGVDYRASDSFVLGGALGYTHQSTTLDEGQGDMSMHGWSLSGYGTWYQKSDWYVDSSITWSDNSFDARRRIAYALPLPGGGSAVVDQTARSSAGGNDFAGSLAVGRDFHYKALAYGFYGKLQYDHSSFDGFQEQLDNGPGSGLGLRVDARSTTSVASVLGAKFDYNASMNWGVLVPHAEIEWQHEYRTDPNSFTAFFLDDPTNTPILIRGDKTDSDFFRIGAGMSFVFTQGRSAFLLYDRTVARQGISEYSLSLGFRLEF